MKGGMAGLTAGVAIALGAIAVAATLLLTRHQEQDSERTRALGASSSVARPRVAATQPAQVPSSAPPRSLAHPMPAAADEVQPDSPVPSADLLDGVEAVRAIDWEKVHSFSPIPRLMPTRRAADAVDAGFAPEWVERSLGEWVADSLKDHGKTSSVPLRPLVERIMSQSKSVEDTWANEAESDLLALTQTNATAGIELISRVFCSELGCLLYLEGTPPTARPTTPILRALSEDSRQSRYGIRPSNIYVTGTGPWDLVIIDRPRR